VDNVKKSKYMSNKRERNLRRMLAREQRKPRVPMFKRQESWSPRSKKEEMEIAMCEFLAENATMEQPIVITSRSHLEEEEEEEEVETILTARDRTFHLVEEQKQKQQETVAWIAGTEFFNTKRFIPVDGQTWGSNGFYTIDMWMLPLIGDNLDRESLNSRCREKSRWAHLIGTVEQDNARPLVSYDPKAEVLRIYIKQLQIPKDVTTPRRRKFKARNKPALVEELETEVDYLRAQLAEAKLGEENKNTWRSFDSLHCTNPGEWNHIRVVFTPRLCKLFVNGKQDNFVSPENTHVFSTQPPCSSFLGASPDGDNGFAGFLNGVYLNVGSELPSSCHEFEITPPPLPRVLKEEWGLIMNRALQEKQEKVTKHQTEGEAAFRKSMLEDIKARNAKRRKLYTRSIQAERKQMEELSLKLEEEKLQEKLEKRKKQLALRRDLANQIATKKKFELYGTDKFLSREEREINSETYPARVFISTSSCIWFTRTNVPKTAKLSIEQPDSSSNRSLIILDHATLQRPF